MATANYPNSLDFRYKKDRPLNWQEMDNMFRKTNAWESDVNFEQGMVVVWDDSLPPISGASGALSSWICNTPHVSNISYAPGTTFGYWDRIGVPSGAFEGPTGPTGPTGVMGITGPTGIQGIQGTYGPTGIQGIQGPLGPQGIQGTRGNPGIQGPTGIQGFIGNQGIQGTYGPTGITGIQGPTGIQGFVGNQGIQGTYGPTGIQGASGIQGFFGTQGSQGIQGNSGTPDPKPIDSVNYYLETPPDEGVPIGSGFNIHFDSKRSGEVDPASISVDNTKPNNGTRFSMNVEDSFFITYQISASISGSPTGRSSFTADLVFDDKQGTSDSPVDGFRGSLTLDVNGQENNYTSDTITVSGFLPVTSSPVDWISRELYVRINAPVGNSTVNLIQDACSITIIRLRGTSGPTGATGANGIGGATGLYGSYYSDTTQIINTINTPYAITFGQVYAQNGISINENSKITLDTIATYKLTFTAQLFNTANSIENAVFWIKYNGDDWPNSSVTVTAPSRKSSEEPSETNIVLNFLSPSQSIGDYIEIYWESTSTDLSLMYIDNSAESIPNSPSVVLDISQISYAGLQGTQGIQGNVGTGIQGIQGISGPQGIQGIQGESSSGGSSINHIGEGSFYSTTGLPNASSGDYMIGKKLEGWNSSLIGLREQSIVNVSSLQMDVSSLVCGIPLDPLDGVSEPTNCDIKIQVLATSQGLEGSDDSLRVNLFFFTVNDINSLEQDYTTIHDLSDGTVLSSPMNEGQYSSTTYTTFTLPNLNLKPGYMLLIGFASNSGEGWLFNNPVNVSWKAWI